MIMREIKKSDDEDPEAGLTLFERSWGVDPKFKGALLCGPGISPEQVRRILDDPEAVMRSIAERNRKRRAEAEAENASPRPSEMPE